MYNYVVKELLNIDCSKAVGVDGICTQNIRQEESQAQNNCLSKEREKSSKQNGAKMM